MSFRPGLLLSFLVGLTMLLIGLTTTEAQQAGNVYRIGVLSLDSGVNVYVDAIRQGLAERATMRGGT